MKPAVFQSSKTAGYLEFVKFHPSSQITTEQQFLPLRGLRCERGVSSLSESKMSVTIKCHKLEPQIKAISYPFLIDLHLRCASKRHKMR
jgi:hypothetical protein